MVTTVDMIPDGRYRREYGKWGVHDWDLGFIAFSEDKNELKVWMNDWMVANDRVQSNPKPAVCDAEDWFLD